MRADLNPTDYSALKASVYAQLAEVPSDYKSCVNVLLRAMREHFPALVQERNPVLQNMQHWAKEELGFIIQEYAGFSNAAIHMFLEARIRNRWPNVTEEIVRNMDEEFGVLTRGIPHLELMRHGYRAELGLATDNVQRTALTEDFIRRMNQLFIHPDNAFLGGVLLAFEGVAVDEFRIVSRMLFRYKELVGGTIAPNSVVGVYIAGHVVPETVNPENDPEMAHYRGMMEAIGSNLAGKDLRPVARGFLSVCLELNRWWEQICAEAYQKQIRDRLGREDVETQDPYPHIAKLQAQAQA